MERATLSTQVGVYVCMYVSLIPDVEKHCLRAIELDPTDPDAYGNLATALYDQNKVIPYRTVPFYTIPYQLDEAQEAAMQALRLGPSTPADIHNVLGLVHLKKRE